MISLVCESFGCTPTQAMHELEHGPAGLIYEILELRAYADATRQVSRAKTQDEMPPGRMTDWVMDVRAEIFKRKKGL